jgi:hypothetical protein
MTVTAMPFDTTPIATETQWQKLADLFAVTGVARGKLNELATFGDSTGMQVKVPSGRAWLVGFFYESDAQITLAIAAADPTNPRIDLVVLELDTTANTITAKVVTGVAAAVPVPPVLTQALPTWQLPLAQVAVGAAASNITAAMVTDARPLVGGEEVELARLVNKSGGRLAAGDVVVIDGANAGAVKTSVIAEDATVLGVALEPIESNATGYVARGGRAKVMTNAAVAIGNYLAVSTTAKQAKVSAALTAGTFAVSLGTLAATGLVDALIFGMRTAPATTVLYPWLIDINPAMTSIAATNWNTIVYDNSLGVSVRMMESSGAQNAALGFDVVLGAGTWTIELLYVKGPNCGIITVQFDGVSQGTIDAYAAAALADSRASLAGLVVATTAKVRLNFLMATKNGSASSYYGRIENIQLRRTA